MSLLLKAGPMRASDAGDFGQLFEVPEEYGARAITSLVETNSPETTAYDLTIASIPSANWPVTLDKLERHPYTCQLFLPMVVGRYIVTLVPDNDGVPDLSGARAFALSAGQGFIYNINVWHSPMTVVEGDAAFVRAMHCRPIIEDDTEWAVLSDPITIEPA